MSTSPAPASVPAASTVDIVIVSYNCELLLRACLRSIEQTGSKRAQLLVHVVDNASTDGTPEMVAREFPEVALHALSENVGFSVANNLVLCDSSARYALVLNPDTELYDGTLDHLLEVLESEPAIGMIGCRLELQDGTLDHASKRGFPTPLTALAHFTGIGRRSDSATLSQYRATGVDEYGFGDVDAVNGAFMLVRREAVLDAGLFDTGYWLYMEDLDWCRRFHLAGWRVAYDGRVSTLHVKSGTAGANRRMRQNVAFHRGMGRFYRRYDAGENTALDLLVYLGIGVKLAVSLAVSAIRRRLASR